MDKYPIVPSTYLRFQYTDPSDFVELSTPAFAETVYVVPPLPVHFERLKEPLALMRYTPIFKYVRGVEGWQTCGAPGACIKYAVLMPTTFPFPLPSINRAVCSSMAMSRGSDDQPFV